jgi:GNAT superfamily N-acetyltransferase
MQGNAAHPDLQTATPAAALPDPAAAVATPPGLTCRIVTSSEQDQALRRIMGHQAHQPLQQRYFQQVAADLVPEKRWLWGAFEAGQMVAAMLIVPQAGKTGMTFVSSPRFRREIDAISALIEAGLHHPPTDRITLAQSLISPDDPSLQTAFERARFMRLATLCYMHARVPRRSAAPSAVKHIQFETYRPSLRNDFIEALEASYQQTRDCPALAGMRRTTDVLTGHMATGRFDPDMWTLVRCDGRPGGALLMNPVPSAGCVEIVYLGLAPMLRGRGLGRLLLKRAFSMCVASGHREVMLAVDESNGPAVALYDSADFVPTTRKVAMVRNLLPKSLT